MKLSTVLGLEKKEEVKSIRLHGDHRAYWYNQAVSEFDKFEMDEMKLKEIIKSVQLKYLPDLLCRELAKHIISKSSSWIVRKG